MFPIEVPCLQVELGVVIGTKCRNVSEQDALSVVAGYVVCNDVSARRWQGKRGGGQWARAKSFDSFTPTGPFLLLSQTKENKPVDPSGLWLRTVVNEQLLQESSTSDMIFGVASLISFVSQGTTLLPGTLLLTGTPSGVGYTRDPPVYLRNGDTVTVSIQHIGSLRNAVTFE